MGRFLFMLMDESVPKGERMFFKILKDEMGRVTLANESKEETLFHF